MNLDAWRERSQLFADLGDREFAILTARAKSVSVGEGEVLFRVNTVANRFYMITDGKIALKVSAPPGPSVTVQTLGEGSLLGLSWRLPPYRWQWTAQAVRPTTLAEFDANEILAACEQDPVLDSAMWRVVAREASGRLQNVRMQLLDVYGKDSP